MNPFTKVHLSLVGVGVLLGTLGAQALKTDAAKELAVKAVVSGMRAKKQYEKIVEQAKAELDDVVAEAGYLAAEEEAISVVDGGKAE
ncbi:DUF1490 domain-containing protein [Collinsella sp. AGMB00827]|uniref:DUF1490 domain-containing protein n=1 Tax=Collinsella ureilytica TaxID=2869515 RepID=A0ABS7MM67_9ACTN|nr:DUF1490 domain-containing protein [Collinsella urealyticum]MBY4798171.1 DUF1490 domain-containing protein [Collinsella urealyticum]